MSKQSENDLLAEEVGEEGEKDKESLTDKRNTVLPRALIQQLKNPTLLLQRKLTYYTNAILGLTKSVPDLLPPPRGGQKANENSR